MAKNKKKIVLGLDMDGVILDHVPNRIEAAKKLGVFLLPHQAHTAVIGKIVPSDLRDKIDLYTYDNESTAMELDLMPNIKEALDTVRRLNIDYFLISRRRNPEVAVKVLKKRKMWPEYFNEQNASFVSSFEDKNIRSRELAVTHYIDDDIRVLEKLLDVENKFLFDNLGVYGDIKDFPRIASWLDIGDILG